MGTMRTLAMLVAAVLAAAGTAAAQVAAPSLNPLPLTTPVPFATAVPSNPAVLSWDMPSRVGIGYSTVEFTQTGAPQNPVGKGNAKQVLAQYVGERFALGASGSTMDIDKSGGGTVTDNGSSVQAAVQFGQWISVGIGQEADKLEDNGTLVSKETLPHAGVTVRLANVIYLGAAGGKATVNSGGPDTDRNVMRYGVAYLWQDKANGVHLEAFQEKRDAATNPAIVDEASISGGSAEFKLGGFMAGYVATKTDLSDPSGNPVETRKVHTISLAWVPEHGFSVGVASTKYETTGSPDHAKFNSVAIAWLF